MPKKKIFLHIGHGKTGTSATQHLLAKNSPVLGKMGIHYSNFGSNAAQGKISSGNVFPQTSSNWFDEQVINVVRDETNFHTYVFSNEGMFFRRSAILPQISLLTSEFSFEIILALRDPIENLKSSYGQMVKRGGFYGEIGEFDPKQRNMALAEEWIRELEQHDIPINLFNYSSLRQGISEKIFERICLAPADLGRLDLITKSKVNRSLTRNETQLIKAVNKRINAKAGKICSDSLVNKLPDIVSEEAAVSFEHFERLRDQSLTSIEFVNQRLPSNQKFEMEFTSVPENVSELSNEQADVFIQTLTEGILAAPRRKLAKQKLFSEQQAAVQIQLERRLAQVEKQLKRQKSEVTAIKTNKWWARLQKWSRLKHSFRRKR